MATFERVSVQRSFFRFPDGLNFGLLELFLGAWFKNVESGPDNVEPSFNNVEPSRSPFKRATCTKQKPGFNIAKPGPDDVSPVSIM